MNNSFQRRQFLKVTAGGAVAAIASRSKFALAAALPVSGQPLEIKIGIIGLDGHYDEILQAAIALPQIKVTAVAESKPELMTSASRRPAFAAVKWYKTHASMLETEPLDLVAVCGENGVRAATIRDCALRHLPIIAEKPLALNLAELELANKAIVEAGIPLTMLLPMRFSGHYAAMKRLVEQGTIGEVVAISAQKSYKLGSRPEWMKVRKSFGGIIPYIGIHMVDLMLWISGRQFVEVAAFQSNVASPEIGEMENNAAILFRMENNGSASLRLDYLRPSTAPTHGDDRLRIAGTKGVIEYQQATGLTLATDRSAPERITGLPATRNLVVDFVSSLHGGKPHSIQTRDAFRLTEIVLKADAAAIARQIQRL
jgi:predicted dehydrogenase